MIDIGAGQDALKIRYNTGLPRILLDDEKLAPFYADVARKQINAVGKAFGENFHIVLKVGDPETANTSLANAITQAEATTQGGQSRYVEMVLTPTKRFSAVSVSGSAWRRSMTDMQSFVKHNGEELDSGLRALNRALMNTIAGDGFGVRGVISGAPSGSTLTLSNRADVFKFRVGMVISAAATKNTTARTGTNRITGVNPATRVLTFANAVDGTWVSGDSLFQSGDFSTTTQLSWLGVQFWIPQTVPGAGTDATGIDRTAGPELIGHRYDASATGTPEEDLIDALQVAASFFYGAGMTCDAIYLNPIDYGKASKILNLAKRGNLEETQQKGKVAAKVGYSQFILSCALGNLPVISDRTFPQGLAYFVTRDAWYVAYDGKDIVAPIDEDGLIYRVASSGADAFTARMVTESQLICERPGENGVCILP